MPRFPGLVGPSYRSQAITADCQAAINCYVEKNESGAGSSPIQLLGTPGSKIFCTLSGLSVRGEIAINGRMFGVSGVDFAEMAANGNVTVRGNVLNDAQPVSMAASAQQILIASAGTAYVFDLQANTLTPIPGVTFSGPVSMVGYSDGFFIALIQDSSKFYVSAPLDATSWDPLDSTVVSEFPDLVISMIVDHREIALSSATKSIIYQNTGAADFPFEPVPGSFIEQGTAAKFSAVRLDNTVFWLGADDRGTGMVWRMAGYTPQRISDHAIEFALQSYPRIDDAIGYSMQDQGHLFYMLLFPTAEKMWVFDATVGMWHERAFWDAANARFTAHRSQCHAFAFGKHLVGDWKSGNVYELSDNFWDDFGNPLRRMRRAPHLAKDQKWIFYHELKVYLETGLGPEPPLLDANGIARDPQLFLRWSDDGGRTFGNEFVANCGQIGEFKKRAVFRRLGRARDRVFEISFSDPVPFRVVDAFIEAEAGTS